MDVGVAISAFLPDVREDELCVTLGAGDRGVHSSQGILGLVVVEFRDLPDRFPRSERVAVFASHCQGGTVRAARGLTRGRLLLSVCGGRRQQQEEHHDLCK